MPSILYVRNLRKKNGRPSTALIVANIVAVEEGKNDCTLHGTRLDPRAGSSGS